MSTKLLTHRNIRNSWSISESPWNSGFFEDISEKMQPTDHMSMGQEYLKEINCMLVNFVFL